MNANQRKISIIFLNKIDSLSNAEVWLTVPDGAAICLLKAGENAFLVYLREEGDSGFHSLGESNRPGNFQVILSNGQLDEYPLAWCIEPKSAYLALSYFFENGGERAPFVGWQED